MKFLIIFISCLSLSSLTQAQDGGMRVYVGATTMTNKDKIANPEGATHSGYHIGIDGRLMGETMSFLVGGRFSNVSRVATDDFKLIGHASQLTIMHGRGGLDISLFNITRLIRIRTKVLASFDIVLNTSGPDVPPAGYMLNDGWLGGVAGLGADIGPLVVDIEYEIGVVNGYNKKPDSTFNSLTFSLGFFF